MSTLRVHTVVIFIIFTSVKDSCSQALVNNRHQQQSSPTLHAEPYQGFTNPTVQNVQLMNLLSSLAASKGSSITPLQQTIQPTMLQFTPNGLKPEELALLLESPSMAHGSSLQQQAIASQYSSLLPILARIQSNQNVLTSAAPIQSQIDLNESCRPVYAPQKIDYTNQYSNCPFSGSVYPEASIMNYPPKSALSTNAGNQRFSQAMEQPAIISDDIALQPVQIEIMPIENDSASQIFFDNPSVSLTNDQSDVSIPQWSSPQTAPSPIIIIQGDSSSKLNKLLPLLLLSLLDEPHQSSPMCCPCCNGCCNCKRT